MKKLSFFAAILLLFSLRVAASHVVGLDLRYDYVDTAYKITLKVVYDCGSPIPIATALNLHIVSVASGKDTTLSCAHAGTTQSVSCASLPNTCQNPGAVIPGFNTAEYTGVISLPPATDWVISYADAARGNMTNISFATSVGFYVEATLDNSTGHNSNPFIPGNDIYMLKLKTYSELSLQAADIDDDSITCELVSARDMNGSNLTYSPGATPANPFLFPSLCSLGNATHRLYLNPYAVGMYSMPIKFSEYRKGKLVGSFVRDNLVLPISSTAHYTTPLPPDSMVVRTCAGQLNNLALKFKDLANDSVFVIATTPAIPGFNFSTTATSAPGLGIANISWNTPVNLDTLALPFFFVQLHVTDNDCPASPVDYVLTVRTGKCITSVEEHTGDNTFAAVIPNPSGEYANLQISLRKNATLQVLVTDITGRQAWKYKGAHKAGLSELALPHGIAPGLYTISIIQQDAEAVHLKWIRR